MRYYIVKHYIAIKSNLFLIALGALLLATSHPAMATTLTGQLFTGGTNKKIPIKNASVTLYEANSTAPTALGNATTKADGSFRIFTSRSVSSSIFYVTANAGNSVTLVSVVGTQIPKKIVINELTTVAAGYSMAQFIVGDTIQGNAFGLRIAAGMNNNLVAPGSGNSSPVITLSPNGDETNSLRSTRSLANLIASFVRGNNVISLADFYILTKSTAGTTPASMLEAFSNIARNPQINVKKIYDLTQVNDPTFALEPYRPYLQSMPDAWTLAVKVNNTGDKRIPFGGPGNIVFDENGYAWITNNLVQGKTYSSRYLAVLKPDGSPAKGNKNFPKSPIFGGGTLGGGFGICIDLDGNVWTGNFGWGGTAYQPSPTTTGSISKFNSLGEPLSGSTGIQGGPDRVQGVTCDLDGNIWIASYGNNTICVFPNGNSSATISYTLPTGGTCPFDVHLADDGDVWVTNSGDMTRFGKGSVGKYYLDGNEIKPRFPLVTDYLAQDWRSLKGFSLDSQGNAWIASGGDDCIYVLASNGTCIGKFGGKDADGNNTYLGGISSPWSTSVDGDDNVWVANFGEQGFGEVYSNACLTKLAGSNAATRPPGSNMGDAISPSTGYTLPSAGAQVRLPNGSPLYGKGRPPVYTPLMRQTAAVIDQGGNIWVTNNFKPNYNMDIIPNIGNPGGDGICIFIGLAKPPIKISRD